MSSQTGNRPSTTRASYTTILGANMEIHQVPCFLSSQFSPYLFPGHPIQLFVKEANQRLYTSKMLIDRTWVLINHQSVQNGIGTLEVDKGNPMWNNWDRGFPRAKGIADGGLRGGRTPTRGETVFHALSVDWETRHMVHWRRGFVDMCGPMIKAAELELEELEWVGEDK